MESSVTEPNQLRVPGPAEAPKQDRVVEQLEQIGFSMAVRAQKNRPRGWKREVETREVSPPSGLNLDHPHGVKFRRIEGCFAGSDRGKNVAETGPGSARPRGIYGSGTGELGRAFFEERGGSLADVFAREERGEQGGLVRLRVVEMHV